MSSRCHPLLCLGLLLAACDQPNDIAGKSAEPPSSARVTKSDRPAAGELPNSRDRLRANFQKAAASGSPEEQTRELAAAVWDALDLEPELAREGLRQLAAGSEEKNRLIEHVAMRSAEQDADDATRWASGLETEEEKSLAFGKIALVLSQEDPARAAQLLSDSGVAGREFDVAVVQVVQRWAQESAQDALAWVSLFEPGAARTASLKEAISIWAMDNPQAALAWISTRQDASLQDDVSAGMAEAILEQPESVRALWLEHAPPAVRERFAQLQMQAEADEKK